MVLGKKRAGPDTTEPLHLYGAKGNETVDKDSETRARLIATGAPPVYPASEHVVEYVSIDHQLPLFFGSPPELIKKPS